METTSDPTANASARVTDLYAAHALGLKRLAYVMLGDQGTAEDVVQDAFLGLYRRWDGLTEPAKALPYLRSSVLNGCRTLLRQQARRGTRALLGPWDARHGPHAEAADARVLLGEEHAEVLAALLRLPARQREAVLLRFYLDMPEDEVAAIMRISRGTVKSATSRGVAALGRMLKDES